MYIGIGCGRKIPVSLLIANSDQGGRNGDHQELRSSFFLSGKIFSPLKGSWNDSPTLESRRKTYQTKYQKRDSKYSIHLMTPNQVNKDSIL